MNISWIDDFISTEHFKIRKMIYDTKNLVKKFGIIEWHSIYA